MDVQATQDESGLAIGIAAELMTLSRCFTRQWWILRGASESNSPLTLTFKTDSIGQPVERTTTASFVVAPWLGSEVLLSTELMIQCCKAMSQGRTVPTSISGFLDSMWAVAQGDRPRALLDAAVACEGAFSEEAYWEASSGRVARGIVRAAIKSSGFIDRVDRDALRIFGRSFKSDHPEAVVGLREMWLARQSIAHGSTAGRARIAALNDEDAFVAAMEAAITFFEWVNTLRVRDAEDPWSAMRPPLRRQSQTRLTLDADRARG